MERIVLAARRRRPHSHRVHDVGRNAPRRRSARVAAVAGLATLVAVLMAAPAHAKVNTFQGECVSIPGTAQWPEDPLRSFPAIVRMVVTVEGGSCSGTLNGQRIDGVPLRAHIDVRGLQNCSGPSAGDGLGDFTIAGATFDGPAHYRRVGLTGVVVIEGDKGGTFDALARPDVGPDELEELMDACNTVGVTEMPVMAERFAAPLGVSSHERK